MVFDSRKAIALTDFLVIEIETRLLKCFQNINLDTIYEKMPIH